MIASLHCFQKRDYPTLPIVSIYFYIFKIFNNILIGWHYDCPTLTWRGANYLKSQLAMPRNGPGLNEVCT